MAMGLRYSTPVLSLLILSIYCQSCTGSKFWRPKSNMALPEAVTSISVVNSQVSSLGEGPYWDAQNKLLYYVDAEAGEFYRLNPATKALEKRTISPNSKGLVSIIIPFQNEKDTFIVSHVNRLLKLNWETGVSTELTRISPQLDGRERFNDAKCDPRGRLFIGTVLQSPAGGPIPNGGGLYRLESGSFIKISEGFTISNGMAWSNDRNATKLYFNDSEGRKIYSFDYDIETGNASNRSVLVDCDNHPDFVANEYPDGMAVDAFGYIWTAMWNGGRVVKINPKTGRVVDQVRFPRVKIPSSLAFGEYQNTYGFYVTTASTGIPTDQLQDDGKIHHVGIIGAAVHSFVPTA